MRKGERLEAIPLTQDCKLDLEFDQIDRVWCIDLGLFNKLKYWDVTEIDDFTGCEIKTGQKYPIKNKYLAIKNILNFLSFVEAQKEYQVGNIIPIPTSTIKKYFTTKPVYKQYIRMLQKLNVLSPFPYKDGKFYEYKEEEGIKVMQYALGRGLINKGLCLVVQRGTNCKIAVDTQIKCKVDKKFRYTIKNVEIDFLNAFNTEIKHHRKNNTSISSLKHRLNALFALADRERYIKKGTNVNRIYHSLSNLSREARKHIYINGHNFNNIDVVACQPCILVYYLKMNGYELDKNYQLDCENGVFYERFYNLSKSRNRVKKCIYSTLFFRFNLESEYNLQFKELYPLTHKSLSFIADDETVTLASLLQNAESSVFNQIVPQFSKYFFLLFDAIYFTDMSDYAKLDKEIKDAFKKMGVSVKTKFNG